MDENELVYSGAIRFSDEYNIGIYIREDEEGNSTIYVRNENTGEVIYPVTTPPLG